MMYECRKCRQKVFVGFNQKIDDATRNHRCPSMAPGPVTLKRWI